MPQSQPLAETLAAASNIVARVIAGRSLGATLADDDAPAGRRHPAVTDAVYGTQRNYGAPDAIIAAPARKAPPDPVVRALLLCALHELRHARRAPHVVVDQAVAACGRLGHGRARGFVNAALCNYLRQREMLDRALGAARLRRRWGGLDGDGYADLAVSSMTWPGATADEGMAQVYRGGAGGIGAGTLWWARVGGVENGQFGFSLGTVDANGDGLADLLIGSDVWDDWDTVVDVGQVSMHHGRRGGMSASPDWVRTGTQNFGYLGDAVASAGDVNGDGFGDIVVGEYGWDGPEADEGRALVFLGSGGTPQDVAGVKLGTGAGSEQYGFAIYQQRCLSALIGLMTEPQAHVLQRSQSKKSDSQHNQCNQHFKQVESTLRAARLRHSCAAAKRAEEGSVHG